MSAQKSSTNVKKRNWAFVLYPESAPAEWRDMLQESGLSAAVSPLHEYDCDPNGEVKKAHYHIILCYPGPTTFNAVKALTCDKLNQPIPQPLDSVRGYYRYFTHKDNPDKFQYDEKDITTINGFNIVDYVELTRSELNDIKRRLQNVIRNEDFTEYSEFMDYILDEALPEEYDVACSNTVFFNSYISSRRHRNEPKRNEYE